MEWIKEKIQPNSRIPSVIYGVATRHLRNTIIKELTKPGRRLVIKLSAHGPVTTGYDQERLV
jgi:hypothetical protein